jgi:glycosyltransferase involved in cell wall biosynthesis
VKKDSSQDVVLPDSASTAPGVVTADAIPSASRVDTEPEATQGEAIDKEAVELEAEAAEGSMGQQTDGTKITCDASQSAAAVEAGRPKPVPSILYCVPASLLDISSGAALSQRTLLISLVSRRFRAVALQATVFDSPQGGEHVLKAGEVHKDKAILRTLTSGVEHIIIRTKAARRSEMTCAEQEFYLNRFREEIRSRRPDMIFVWGGMLLEMTMMREAREAGIPVIFYLVNPGYKNKETFKYVSTVVTDTVSTAKLYKERLGLDCKVLGKFIDTGLIKPKVPRRPDFITFINPSFEKGVSVFMPLAKLAAKECPEIKFLVVQARGRWGNALHVLKFKPEDFPNVKVIGHQTDMRPVYASTRALLLPSLWHESGARVIAEAQINGIPILASRTGGSAELVGQGGKIFDIPEDVREHKTELLVTEETLRPWIEEIKRIWNDQAYYEALCKQVEKEAEQHDIERNTTRFIQAVAPVVLASKGVRPPAQPIPKAAQVSGNRAARREFKHARWKHMRRK